MRIRSPICALGLALLCVGFLTSPPARAQTGPPVFLSDEGDRVLLDDAFVSIEVAKSNGNLVSVHYHGHSIMAKAGYLDWVADRGGGRIRNGKYAVVTDPRTNAGKMAEISVTQKFNGGATAFPSDVEIHYVLRRGDSGPYVFVIFTHPADYPLLSFGQSRWVLNVDDSIFDFINIDAQRRYVMPPSNTPTKQLGPKESLMYTAGPFAGQITDKYHCYVDDGDHFFHGWTGTTSHLGCWVVFGSNESQNGGPTKQHNDAQWGRLLFKILTCTHYGAAGMTIKPGQAWQKIYGPWMLYMDSARSNDDLWADVQKKAAAERAAWPPVWMHSTAFPLASQRGSVSGQLHITDPQDASASPANAWVGLAAASPDWQQQSDGYQFWDHADADGKFSIRNVRPGHYTLYAFVGGVMDQFRHDGVTIAAGSIVDLGTMDWQPLRYGKQIWQIGTPDRTAKEFRHGDDFHHWGLWQKYPEDFPSGVNFVIGKSNPRTDWNYAQVEVQKDGQWVGTTWNILFDMPSVPPAGTAILRLAMASTHNATLKISVNGKQVDQFHTAMDNAMIRAGIHGQYSEQDTFFDAGLLKTGTNTIALEQAAGGSVQISLMYDCVRFELDDSKPFDPSLAAAHPHVFPQGSTENPDDEN